MSVLFCRDLFVSCDFLAFSISTRSELSAIIAFLFEAGSLHEEGMGQRQIHKRRQLLPVEGLSRKIKEINKDKGNKEINRERERELPGK